jgi:hypothetical protein
VARIVAHKRQLNIVKIVVVLWSIAILNKQTLGMPTAPKQPPDLSAAEGTMILLRFLAILAGALVMMAPPMFMFAGATGPHFFDGRTVLTAMAGLALVAASFLFIGAAGDRMRKSARLRSIGGLLLAMPLAASCALLWRGNDELELWLGALAFCFAAVLFVAFVFPAVNTRNYRPLRAREAREPRLTSLGRG